MVNRVLGRLRLSPLIGGKMGEQNTNEPPKVSWRDVLSTDLGGLILVLLLLVLWQPVQRVPPRWRGWTGWLLLSCCFAISLGCFLGAIVPWWALFGTLLPVVVALLCIVSVSVRVGRAEDFWVPVWLGPVVGCSLGLLLALAIAWDAAEPLGASQLVIGVVLGTGLGLLLGGALWWLDLGRKAPKPTPATAPAEQRPDDPGPPVSRP
jgi:hypothetical protein